jgi:glucose/arabinose dehydrogenase
MLHVQPADPSQHVKAVHGNEPHHANLGNRFYRSAPTAMFPEEFNNTLFVAIHSSLHRPWLPAWNSW